MANEFTLSANLTYEDSEMDDPISLAVNELLDSVVTKKFIHAKQSIGTSEEVIDLGELTAIGWALFINRDTTNFLSLKTGTGGTIFAKLKPGKFAMFHFGSGVTAPCAIADTAACQLEYLIVNT